MHTISLNIAKSNYLLLDSLKAALGKFKDIEVLGEYSSYQEAARGLSNQVPDVLLLYVQIDSDFEGSLNEDSGLELLDYVIKKT